MESTLRFARTLSLMINRECGMQCPHCDLPSQYNTYGKRELSAEQWKQVLDRIIPVIQPSVTAITAREPLFDPESREKTRRILETARAHHVSCGFVTNGIHINEFFQELDPPFWFDYMDISLEGMAEIDQTSRGHKHFDIIQRFVQEVPYHLHVGSLFVSSTLTALNSDEAHLKTFSSWITSHLAHPRLALLLLYPNHNVAPELTLCGDDVSRIIEHAVSVSSGYDDIFLEAFPGSIPNLHKLVDDNILPGAGEVFHDEAGMLCGHVADNLFIRYLTPTDLARYHLRISPEGMILTPSGIEQADYARGNLGDIAVEDFSIIQKRVQKLIEKQNGTIPRQCRDKRCFEVCGASNQRCSLFENESRREWTWQPALLSVPE